MLGIFGNVQLRCSDHRKISPLTNETPFQNNNNNQQQQQQQQQQQNINSIEALRSRTTALAAQHQANSRKALLDEQRVREREESSQLMQLSLRMVLDIVDRRQEVASLDCTFYAAAILEFDFIIFSFVLFTFTSILAIVNSYIIYIYIFTLFQCN